jgi:BirA family biotin operon repressor/biotin-[acetyl-CoA-carboxylase] ligase
LNATIKWVNDVLLNGRKAAGILTETMHGPRGGEEYVLIGIGINVNNTTFVPELRHTAAAMAEFSAHPLDVGEVAARLLAKLAWNIGLLHYAEELALAGDRGVENDTTHPLVTAWRGLSDTIGRQVRFGFNVVEQVLYTARAVGIDNQGHLQLRLADGRLVTEIGGEIVYA